MKIPVIKKLVDQYTIEQLGAAENALLLEKEPDIELEGDEPGDKLTNVMAAIWIKEHIAEKSVDLMTAIRAYSQKVRDSIS